MNIEVRYYSQSPEITPSASSPLRAAGYSRTRVIHFASMLTS